MKRDYDWLMMVMGKLTGQCDRGLITLHEFYRELDLAIIQHWDYKSARKEGVMSSYGG